jgi:hypothetical protein
MYIPSTIGEPVNNAVTVNVVVAIEPVKVELYGRKPVPINVWAGPKNRSSENWGIVFSLKSLTNN